MVEVFSVQDGLDAERALLDEVCGGAREHGLLLWQPCDRALVMPRRMERLEGFAPASAAVAERGWPVLLRDTGGEPVPQSPGVLNIALSYALGPGDNEQTRIETAYLRLCQPICDWLLQEARRLGVRGATALAASEGFGQSGRLHSMHFFELADQPQEILMAVDPEQAERLFESIRQAGVRLFYMKVPIEFGVLGADEPSP